SFFFFSSRRRHTIWPRDWSSDVCSSDLWSGGWRGPSAPISALLLRRTCAEIGAEGPRQPPLQRKSLALLARLRRLLVQRRRYLRRPASVGEPGDHDDAAHCPEPDLDRVAGRDLPRRLDPFAAHFDVTREDEVGRGAPRLCEARCPQPLVDAHPIHGVILPTEDPARRPAGRSASAQTA